MLIKQYHLLVKFDAYEKKRREKKKKVEELEQFLKWTK